MDSDEQKKAQESNVAKQMALLADGGTPTGVPKKTPTGANDLIKELKEQMYGADPVNTYMPTQQDFSTQLMQYLAQMFIPGLVQQGQYNVPTAAHGNYADVPSHASGGSIGYHQPGSLEQNMMALGGHRALPIIMALHKANGGRIDLPKFAGGGDLSVSEQLAQDLGVPQDTSDKEPSPYPYVAYQKSTVPYDPGPDKPGVQSLDPISVHMQKPSFLQNLGENILGAADLGKTLVGGTLGMVPAALETGARMFTSPNTAQDIYEQALSHYTPDLMTQRGKEMGEDLAGFMQDYKIPLALPELMAFEGALGPGAGAALRKSNQALKALEPEAGTLGSNLQMQKELASKEDALRLYHGSPEENLSQVQDKGLFGGVFGHVDKDVALSHGDHIYHSDIPESKILTNDDLNYYLPYKKVSKALNNNLPHLARNKDLREKAWEAIIEDKDVLHLDEDELQKIFGTSDLGEAGWEAQQVRGAIAKDLGYQAVEMEDEHGTSHLILPGAKLHKSSKEKANYD